MKPVLGCIGYALLCAACGSASPASPGDGGSPEGSALDGGGSDAFQDAPAKNDATPPAAHIKWNPGHYGETYGPILGPGTDINTYEMATLSGKSAIVGYKALVYWASLDLGPVTFTGPVGGASSGTLASASTSGGGGQGVSLQDGTYWFAFSDGSYRKVTLAGTSCSWSGSLGTGAATAAYVFQFGQIDAQLAYLETKLDTPRHYALTVLPGSFGSTTADGSIIPNYIVTDPAMGSSPVSGSFGWWGGSGNGNTATAALHRTAVNDRWIALVKALGAYYDSEPYFEAFMVQEDSWEEGALVTNGCPDFSNTAYLANMRAFLSAAVSAFPHTNVEQQNSWVGDATDAQELADWMTKNRVAPGNADTWGQSDIVANGIAKALPWGVAAYTGTVVSGSTWSPAYDMRPLIRYMPDVEGPDLGLFGGIGGGPFTPADLMSSLNDTLEASHVFWSIIPDNTTGIQAPNDNGQVWWSNLTTFLAANPLTHTAYPAAYP